MTEDITKLKVVMLIPNMSILTTVNYQHLCVYE